MKKSLLLFISEWYNSTAQTPTLVKDINTGFWIRIITLQGIAYNGIYLFRAESQNIGQELWTTDGLQRIHNWLRISSGFSGSTIGPMI
jgi:hypothetical protein